MMISEIIHGSVPAKSRGPDNRITGMQSYSLQADSKQRRDQRGREEGSMDNL